MTTTEPAPADAPEERPIGFGRALLRTVTMFVNDKKVAEGLETVRPELTVGQPLTLTGAMTIRTFWASSTSFLM